MMLKKLLLSIFCLSSSLASVEVFAERYATEVETDNLRISLITTTAAAEEIITLSKGDAVLKGVIMDAKFYERQYIDRQASSPVGVWAIRRKEDNSLIGLEKFFSPRSQMMDGQRVLDLMEVTIHTSSSSQNKGYMSESHKALMEKVYKPWIASEPVVYGEADFRTRINPEYRVKCIAGYVHNISTNYPSLGALMNAGGYIHSLQHESAWVLFPAPNTQAPRGAELAIRNFSKASTLARRGGNFTHQKCDLNALAKSLLDYKDLPITFVSILDHLSKSNFFGPKVSLLTITQTLETVIPDLFIGHTTEGEKIQKLRDLMPIDPFHEIPSVHTGYQYYADIQAVEKFRRSLV